MHLCLSLGGIKNHLRERYKTRVLFCGIAFGGCLLAAVHAYAQEDKKTDDDKPADPDTGESTVEEKTLGLLPNPLLKYGVKFAATYIGEAFGNASGGLKQGALRGPSQPCGGCRSAETRRHRQA